MLSGQDPYSTPSSGRGSKSSCLDFAAVNAAARAHLPQILARWLPDGVKRGAAWVALNPTRDDRHLGSFSVNISTGQWADFATGDKGGDVVSLAAYLHGVSQGEAACRLADMLGIGSRG